ncbi:MAG: response regulator, partial [Planctomycetaceae bacterium]|nr:response regulator [Planctomycetaceae bacterium]
MLEKVFLRTGPRYIMLMMLATRAFAVVSGCLCIYYVHLGIELPPTAFRHLVCACLSVIGLAVVVTLGMAQYNTRHLRRLIGDMFAGRPVSDRIAELGSRQAVTFPAVNARYEALVDPLITAVPICVTLAVLDDVKATVLLQVCFATFLGLSCIILATFYISERCLQPVIQFLLRSGVDIRFEQLPRSKLGTRLQIGFAVVIMVTAVMIGAVANQRVLEIIRDPAETRFDKVVNLQFHTVIITVAAVLIATVYSQVLARSVASRVRFLVSIMKRVQAGDLSQRVQPTGNDEIDTLARQFNAMVENLQEQAQTVRDLNLNLERKVRSRTEELAQSQRSLQISLEKLRESDRHKTEFFSNISHELRTPLMMILSPLDQVAKRDDAGLSDKSRSLVNVASTNANRLLKLINQLLDFSKLEAGHLKLRHERVDLRITIDRLIEAATPLAEQRGLSLSADIQPDLPITVADEEKLDAIITNLMSNALKFTPRGGSVVVRAAVDHSGESRRLRIDVVDSGRGIAPENLHRLFQRFSQIDGSTSREFAGTGLGLALVKELVELHGGTIHVDSQPGRGSCFWFTLPLVEDAMAAGPQSHDSGPILRTERFADLATCAVPTLPSAPPVPGSHKVLVVDDTPEVRQLVGEILSEHYHVIYAEDGESGWQSVLEETPDLIISDVMMPRVDGNELCRRVKENPATAAIPFVLLTARAQVSLKIEGLNCGADDYLVKPFHAEELLARARALLRLRQMHSDLSAKHARLEETFAELRQTQNQLVQAEKMSSLGQLTAGLAHEINNAINAVYNGIPAISDRLDRLQQLVVTALDDGLETPGEDHLDVDAAFKSLR